MILEISSEEQLIEIMWPKDPEFTKNLLAKIESNSLKLEMTNGHFSFHLKMVIDHLYLA